MVAIITARAGSKRIPNKNIKDFLGKPIIAYSIEVAIKSKLFDRVMVSTDSEEIRNISLKYGAEVPFMRSKETASDFASTRDVLVEVIKEYNKIGVSFDEFACIYPTAPFINSEILINAYNVFKNEGANGLVPVVKFSFPPQRGFTISDGNLMVIDENKFKKRSQDLEPIYHDCGQFYFYKTISYLNSNNVLLDNTIPFVMDEKFVHDIDSINDWQMAEFKYRFMLENKLV